MPDKVLLVSAHADDAVMGAGASAVKWKRLGAELGHIVFTLSELENGVGFTADEIQRELNQVNTRLGVDHTTTYSLPVHFLPRHGYEIRKSLEELRDLFHPDLVVAPSLKDPHQDHVAVATEVLRVFRGGETVVCYEIFKNSVSHFTPNVFVDVSEDVKAKRGLLDCFLTQVNRPYMGWGVFEALAKLRGIQIGVKYAEAFEAVKVIL